MIDHLATHLALRNRALSLVVAATGLTSLSATTTGYHRAAGSFVTDGFLVGMELTPSGFAANPVDVITGVTASDLTTKNARAVESVPSGRSLTVGLPALRAFENSEYTPVIGRPYVEEDYAPASAVLAGQRSGGIVYDDGLYVIKWYGLPDVGVSAIRKSVDALRALFAPGTALTAGANVVRIRTDVAPQTSQILKLTSGWAVLTLTIPWRAESINAIAP